MDVAKFRELPLLGIVRGARPEEIEPLVQTAASAGLRAIEIAINSRGAPELIARAARAAGPGLAVGAGTVLTRDALRSALDAGATFIVTPTLIPDVVGWCRSNRVPVFPGALTPTEIWQAWNAGATLVKLFPASLFGPAYCTEIKGPFPQVDLLACGGVTPENAKAFLEAGASAVAFGASVFKKDWLESGRYDRIGEQIRALVLAVS